MCSLLKACHEVKDAVVKSWSWQGCAANRKQEPRQDLCCFKNRTKALVEQQGFCEVNFFINELS
jgi:hypothetical protein